MSDTAPRSPEPSSRREEILDSAFELVRERGSAGLRIRALAERVGVTEGALYRHFASKEAILTALAGRLAERLLGPIRRLAAQDELPARERLEGILRHHLGILLETDSLPMLLVAEASFSEHQELQGRMRETLSAYLRVLEGLVAELPQQPGGLEPRELAMLLLGLPAALAIRHRLLPDPGLEERLRGPVVAEYMSRLLPG